MKITLILPDLHLRWRHADKIIKHVGISDEDEIIFLGDFFDDFGDDPNSIGEMCDWLEDSATKPNRIHLFGNHDLHYAFAHNQFPCSGYAQWKYFLIHDRFEGLKIWDKFKYYHVLDGKWLLTHAGLHQNWVPKEIAELHVDRPKFLKALTAYLDQEIVKGHRDESWMFHAGHSRGGFQPVGGISWCDYTCEFHPVKGLNQMLGHTPQRQAAVWTYLKGNSKPTRHPINAPWKPTPSDYDDVQRSYNICLDVHGNMHWAVWQNEDLTFGNYREDL